MAIILDAVLLLILAAFIFSAVKKGFAKALLELVAVIAALAAAYYFSPVVSQAAYDNFIEDSVIKAVDEQLSSQLDASGLKEGIEVTIDAIPDFIADLAESAGVDLEGIKSTVASAAVNAGDTAASLAESVAEPIIVGILTIAAFAVLAIVLLIVLRFLADLLAGVFKIPLVNTADKALGGVLGAVKGVLVIVLICTVLELFSGGDGELSAAVRDSRVMDALRNINPFIDSLKDIIK